MTKPLSVALGIILASGSLLTVSAQLGGFEPPDVSQAAEGRSDTEGDGPAAAAVVETASQGPAFHCPIVPAATNDYADPETIPAWGNDAKTQFMYDTYCAHLDWTLRKKKRTYVESLPRGSIGKCYGTEMESAAATACTNMLSAARSALAREQTADRAAGKTTENSLALRTLRIYTGSGYRNVKSGKKAWRATFNKHYNKTSGARKRKSGGKHGAEAVEYFARVLRGWKALPGFSNHSRGKAMDFKTKLNLLDADGSVIRCGEKDIPSLAPDQKDKRDMRRRRKTGCEASGDKRGWVLGASSGQKAAWRQSWLHDWLKTNASQYDFKPYRKEEWHWDHKP